MSKVVTGAVALVVIAGGGVGFASWSGNKVGADLQKQTADALAPFAGAKVIENRVDKGLFKSTHTVAIDVGCPPSADAIAAGAPPFKATRISWKSDVQHGPLPGGKSLGLAVINTELILSPEAKAAVTKVMGDKAPVTARTTLGFGGGYTTELTSPAFKFAEEGKGSVDWQGVKGTFTGNLSKGMAAGGSYTLDAPGLAIDMVRPEDKGTVRLGAMKFEGTVQPHSGTTLLMAPAVGKGTLANLTVAGTLPDANGPRPFEVVLDNVEFSSEAKVDKDLWDAVTKLSAKGRVDDFPIDKIEAQVSLKRIHAPTYEQMMLKTFQQALKCERPDAAAAAATEEDMMKGLTSLLVHNPEYSLDRLAVTLGGKVAEMSYALGSKGVTEEDIKSQPLQQVFMTKGYGKVAAKVDIGWIEAIVKKVATLRKSPDQTPEAQTASMMAFVNMMIDQGAAQNFLVRDGEAVKSEGSFEAGKVTLNGKPFNVPMPGMAPQ